VGAAPNTQPLLPDPDESDPDEEGELLLQHSSPQQYWLSSMQPCGCVLPQQMKPGDTQWNPQHVSPALQPT
jgi:hypothetical protein